MPNDKIDFDTSYTVRAAHCDHRAADEVVYQALVRATAPLSRAWEKLEAADRIAIKFNQDWPVDEVVTYAGQRQQLVSDSVARATLRLLRERTAAEIVCVDVSYHVMYGVSQSVAETTTLPHVLKEYEVPLIDGTRPPYVKVGVPGGGQMFEEYAMLQDVVDADALVSVAKMKNHGYMGVTGCLKNLFGLMPGGPVGRSRHYYHHLVRMPYMLADIGRIMNPALNIVDALIGQAGREWGDGEGMAREVNGLIAGDQVIATDAVVTHLMGHDPQSDWLTPPFHRDRNAILVAAEGGFGTVDLDRIDWTSELVFQPPGVFFAKEWDDLETVVTWRRTMCEQALYYRDHMAELVDAYAGEYILLQDGEVRWHDENGMLRVSRRKLAGKHKNHAMFFKYVDPEEREQEHFEVYEQALADIVNQGLDNIMEV
jgi:uncharacterized protein (DUF362 family)